MSGSGRALRVIGGVVAGYVVMVLLSALGGWALSGIVPQGPMLGGWQLGVDFLFAMVSVAAAGWLAGRIGGAAAVWLVAVLIVVASVAAPSPNWPRAAGIAYAVAGVGLLVWMGWMKRESVEARPASG